MRNRTYGGVRGRKTKVGRKLLRFPPTRFVALFKFVAYAPWKVHIYAQYAPSKVHIYVFSFKASSFLLKVSFTLISNNCQRFLSVCSDYCLVMEEYSAEE